MEKYDIVWVTFWSKAENTKENAGKHTGLVINTNPLLIAQISSKPTAYTPTDKLCTMYWDGHELSRKYQHKGLPNYIHFNKVVNLEKIPDSYWLTVHLDNDTINKIEERDYIAKGIVNNQYKKRVLAIL